MSVIGAIQFLSTTVKLKQEAEKFFKLAENHPPFLGCVGALDGIAICITLPKRHECDNPLLYPNNKGFAAINAQVIASADLRCLLLSINRPGSTHHSTACNLTTMTRYWDSNNATAKYPGTDWLFWIENNDSYPGTVTKFCTGGYNKTLALGKPTGVAWCLPWPRTTTTTTTTRRSQWWWMKNKRSGKIGKRRGFRPSLLWSSCLLWLTTKVYYFLCISRSSSCPTCHLSFTSWVRMRTLLQWHHPTSGWLLRPIVSRSHIQSVE